MGSSPVIDLGQLPSVSEPRVTAPANEREKRNAPLSKMEGTPQRRTDASSTPRPWGHRHPRARRPTRPTRGRRGAGRRPGRVEVRGIASGGSAVAPRDSLRQPVAFHRVNLGVPLAAVGGPTDFCGRVPATTLSVPLDSRPSPLTVAYTARTSTSATSPTTLQDPDGPCHGTKRCIARPMNARAAGVGVCPDRVTSRVRLGGWSTMPTRPRPGPPLWPRSTRTSPWSRRPRRPARAPSRSSPPRPRLPVRRRACGTGRRTPDAWWRCDSGANPLAMQIGDDTGLRPASRCPSGTTTTLGSMNTGTASRSSGTVSAHVNPTSHARVNSSATPSVLSGGSTRTMTCG